MFPVNPILIIIASSILVLFVALYIWLKRGRLNVECRDPLFNKDTRAFHGQLDIAVRSHLNIFPAMPVHDVFTARRLSPAGSLLSSFKHSRFDYVLCHRREMSVLCVINLVPYGKSNDSRKQKRLRELCDAAGLTLLEFDIKPYRDVPSLRNIVFGACGIDEFDSKNEEVFIRQGSETARDERSESEVQECPKCGNNMKLTTIKKGERAGQECWVCCSYPECKGARLV